MKYCVELSSICKSFNKVKVINDISLEIPEGKIIGFIGPNGSGKSTLINIICGLISIDGGSGSCMGFDISLEQAKIKSSIGYMTQNFTLWESLTVIENLKFIGTIRGVSDVDNKVELLMIRLGLDRFKNTLARHLSGGWKQKLSLACAIVHSPKMLFLDEPTASVDPLSRKEFWNLIYELSAQGMTILIVTHAIDEIEKCDRLFYMNKGDLLFAGSLSQLLQSHSLTTILVKGESFDEFFTEMLRVQKIQIVHRDKWLAVTGYLNIEELKVKYPDLIIETIKTPLESVLYNLSCH
ncbi:ABC transporter ATP-binding protein [Rosenbergiella australiborealis]|uniref:ABC transporter ATP-binding protein n=1 Tax=Rosenbergiella australiborealis TaxID=1544696 RepID=UPI001F4E13DC|nr:ABC transporter ATP-binding protein [Rosenbergiella australiborealis]